MTTWPYPGFGSAAWLTGAPDDDALVVTREAVAAVLHDRGQLPGPGPGVVDGLRALADLRERLDWAMLALVGEGRAARLPWSEIAAALGVSRQAAQQRFGAWVEQAHAQAAPDPAPDADDVSPRPPNPPKGP